MGLATNALMLKAAGRSQELTGTVRLAASVMVAAVFLPPSSKEQNERRSKT